MRCLSRIGKLKPESPGASADQKTRGLLELSRGVLAEMQSDDTDRLIYILILISIV